MATIYYLTWIKALGAVGIVTASRVLAGDTVVSVIDAVNGQDYLTAFGLVAPSSGILAQTTSGAPLALPLVVLMSRQVA